jgi:hypothetical protein
MSCRNVASFHESLNKILSFYITLHVSTLPEFCIHAHLFSSCVPKLAIRFHSLAESWIVPEIKKSRSNSYGVVNVSLKWISFVRWQFACSLPIPRSQHAMDRKCKKLNRKQGPTPFAISGFSRKEVRKLIHVIV